MDSHKIFSTALLTTLTLGAPAALAQDNTQQSQNQPQVSPDVKEINWIGFQNLADGSRVFIRANEPFNYRLSPTGETELVLSVFNSYLITDTLRYPMDCSNFDSPVLNVRVETIDDITPSVQIVVTLRAAVPYEVKQDNNMVYMDFHR